MVIRALSLCAGIGGIDLGLKRAMGENYRTVCYVEREAYAAACLVARIKEGKLCDAPIWADLKTFDAKPWRGKVDLITGGYPCQPFSCAGKRQGANDERHLWPNIASIVRAIQPAQCFFENVPGHVSLGLEQVTTDLQAMGYTVSAGIFSAAQCGAPHIRKRLFILANSASTRCSEGRRQENESLRNETWRSKSQRPCSDVADADAITWSEECNVLRRGRSDFAWRSGRWPTEPDVGRVADGVPFRVERIAALGNAVVPATAALAWSVLTHA